MITLVYLISAVALGAHRDEKAAFVLALPFFVFADWYFGI